VEEDAMNARCLFVTGLAMASLLPSVRADDLEARFRLTLDRVLKGGPPQYTPDFVLADAAPRPDRRFTEFSGDVSGRYLEALARAEPRADAKFDSLDAVLGGLPALQKPAGFFGEAFNADTVKAGDMAILWGNGRLLIGFMEAYRRRGDTNALAAARKLGDFFVRIGPRLNDPKVREAFSGDQHAVGYICWTQIIEGLVALHAATKDAHYRDLAMAVADRVSRHPGQHSHGFLTSLRGMVDLYRVTGQKRFLDKAAAEWQGVIDSGNLLPHGAVPEAFRPMMMRDEGCAEADWLRLSLALWASTRDLKYLDEAEHELFNEFSLNQFADGDFGHRTIGGSGVGGSLAYVKPSSDPNAPMQIVGGMSPCARAWWCCTLHGLRAFPDVMDSVFHAERDTLYYDLPVSGTGAVGSLAARADSTLARDASVRLEITAADGAKRTIALRCPAWSDSPAVSLNGQAADARIDGGWLKIQRVWTKGDALVIQYPLLSRVVENPVNTNVIGLAHGPWMLGVEPSASPAFFDEPMQRNTVEVPGLPANPVLLPAKAEAAAPNPFAVPVARFALRFIPGGYPVQPQTALLRPLAEQTGLADATEWIFWFRPAAAKP
jgi:DUF1680 family protein